MSGDSASTSRRRALRVCVVAASARMVGGQSAQALLLLRRLGELSEVEVSFIPIDPQLPRVLRALQRVRYVRTVPLSIAYAISLIRLVPRCDVVHAFSASYVSYLLSTLPALVVGRLARCRTVLHYHSGEAEDHLARWPLSRFSMRLASVIVVPSDYLVGVFARAGLRACAIPNFVEIDQLPFRVRRVLAPRFFTNRHLEPMYNVQNVLEAFEIVQARHPDASLVIAGAGSLADSLRLYTERRKLRHVRFVGRVDPATMAALYTEADVYVNGSDVDNLPVSILEAFAAGLPVVTTAAGGIPFLVRDGDDGLLVPRRDPRALAAAMERVLVEPGLAWRLSARAYQAVSSRYVWSSARSRWLEIYRGDSSQSAPAVPGVEAALLVDRQGSDATAASLRAG